jgi:hypothetical protein
MVVPASHRPPYRSFPSASSTMASLTFAVVVDMRNSASVSSDSTMPLQRSSSTTTMQSASQPWTCAVTAQTSMVQMMSSMSCSMALSSGITPRRAARPMPLTRLSRSFDWGAGVLRWQLVGKLCEAVPS